MYGPLPKVVKFNMGRTKMENWDTNGGQREYYFALVFLFLHRFRLHKVYTPLNLLPILVSLFIN